MRAMISPKNERTSAVGSGRERRSMKIFQARCMGWLLALLAAPALPLTATEAKYVIVLHGDGMGAEHIRAGGMYAFGKTGTLGFEAFPSQTAMRHNNAFNQTTDSAASATAMATGAKVANGVVSVRLPGDGSRLATVLELHKSLNKRTGLVTESFMTDASPACYGAHTANRGNYDAIFNDYLTRTRPDILLGGGGYAFVTPPARAAGYHVVTDRAGLLSLNPDLETAVAGCFGSGMIPPDGMAGRDAALPTLPEMTAQALAVLSRHAAGGFFLFVEEEGIDEYSHGNQAEGMVKAMKEFNAAAQIVTDWVDSSAADADWTNTLVVVLADHETGGLAVTETNPQAGVVPAMNWSTTGHTQTPVRVFAKGSGAGQITGAQIENTDLFPILAPDSAATPSTPFHARPAGPITASPNPGKTFIQFSLQLESQATVHLALYNLAGEPVADLRSVLPAGPGKLIWDCRTVASGLYLVKAKVDTQTVQSMKVAVLH